ncbi:putative nucleotide-binding protein containing TIR-like domain protein [compost metagenome]
MPTNYKYIAIKLGDELKNTITLGEIDRFAGALFDFPAEAHEAPGVTSARAQRIYDWVLTLAKQPIRDEDKSYRLLELISGLGADVSKYVAHIQKTTECDIADKPASNKVFLVHGRDEALKETVGRFIGRIGLDVVILSEKANQGQTIVEKLERSADVAFCVVLLTPDDVGKLASNGDQALRSRARQNVILELGYFTGRLGRDRVCALVAGDVELPSDIHGIAYVPVDPHNGWQIKLIQELKSAGLVVNLDRIFGE